MLVNSSKLWSFHQDSSWFLQGFSKARPSRTQNSSTVPGTIFSLCLPRVFMIDHWFWTITMSIGKIFTPSFPDELSKPPLVFMQNSLSLYHRKSGQKATCLLIHSWSLRSSPRFPSLDQELDLKRRVLWCLLRIFRGSDNFKANYYKANLCQTDYHCLLERQWQRLLFLLWLSIATPQTIGLIGYLNFEIKTIKIAPIINDYLILMFINAAPVVEVRTPMISTVSSLRRFIARQLLQWLL